MPERKTGGLNRSTTIMIAAGSVGAYLIYRWYQNRQAAAAQTATTGGTTIPAALTSSASTPNVPASLDQWLQQAISGTQYPAGYTNASLYNDLQAWLNGNCVSAQGYNIIGNLISTQGVPPGYSPPFLSACASTPANTSPTAPATAGQPTKTVPKNSGYTLVPNPSIASVFEKEGTPLYVGIPLSNGQWEFTPAPKGLAGLPGGTPIFTWTGAGT